MEWNLSRQEPGLWTANWGCFEDLLTLPGQNKEKGRMNWTCSVTQLLGSSKQHVTTSPEGQPTSVCRFSVNRPEGCPALGHACGVISNNLRGEWTLPTPLISCLSLLVFFYETRTKPGEASRSCGQDSKRWHRGSPQHSTRVKGLSHHHTCVCGTVGHDRGQCTKES